ncbi:UNKNOWN [Stylonychia lemnae]|uniref:Uncharacterized protein n=1 Tax=Stylonychia lemnae TaxID=5949 RepID=A0A077ZUJ0_STYLE|nr:UNKNOWN [Stylonychia lemnae]|eukprot:CDW72136.1 UNKNOWN [Stylonychia lemnae]
MQYSQKDVRPSNYNQIDDSQLQSHQNPSSKGYYTQDTRGLNPVIQSLSDKLRPDIDEDSNEYIAESYQDQKNDNSYYLNFADDNRSTNNNLLNHQNTGGHSDRENNTTGQNTHRGENRNNVNNKVRNYYPDDGGEFTPTGGQMGAAQYDDDRFHINDTDENFQDEHDLNHDDDQQEYDDHLNNNENLHTDEIEEIFQQQQQTSKFPTSYNQSSRNPDAGNRYNQGQNQLNYDQAAANGADAEQKDRQQKIKEMLKEFNKKKEQVIREQIKSRVGSSMNTQPQQQSTKNSTSKQIFLVDQQTNNQPISTHRSHLHHHHQQSQNFQQTITFTVEDDTSKTKYEVGKYKSVCNTCKSMKQNIEMKKPRLQEPRRGALPSKGEPAFIDVKKIKQKYNIPDINPNALFPSGNRNGGSQGMNESSRYGQNNNTNSSNLNNSQQNNHLSNSKYNRYPFMPARTKDLKEYSYDDLIKLVEQLERENAELRQLLFEANSKLSKMEDRDDLILQYQNEVQLAKQRLNTNTQALKDVQNIFKLMLGLINDLFKTSKSLNLDQAGKKKLAELANRMKQIIGGPEFSEKFDSLIQDNNLQGIMQECLQTKVKNTHQKEILSLEKGFHDNLDKMREQINDELMRKFKNSIERQNEDISDKQEQIDELRETKAQLKDELLRRDSRIDELQNHISYLEEERNQLEDIVKEADQALLLKEQYGLLQLEYQEQQEKLSDKIDNLEQMLREKDHQNQQIQKDYEDELARLKGVQDGLFGKNKDLEAIVDNQKEQLKKLDELKHLRQKMDEVDKMRISFTEKEKLYEQKERNRKLLQEQLDDLEERYRLIEKAKKKLEIDLGTQKQTKEKLIDQNHQQEEEIKRAKDEINQLISDKVETENELSNKNAILQKLEGALKDKKEFQKLEDLVQQLQSTLMFKSHHNFSDNERMLIRELFGVQPGENADMGEKITEMKDENSKLYFELRNGYDHEADALKKQKDYLKQLQDFAKAILSIEDKVIEKNLNFTLQKRNKAPLYANVEQLVDEIQQRIDDIDQKQKGLDRMSLAKGMDKYDNPDKVVQQLHDISHVSSSKSLKYNNTQSPDVVMRKGSKKNYESSLETGIAVNMYATMQTPRSNLQEQQINQNQPLSHRDKVNPMGRISHLKNTSNNSDLGHNFLKDAVDDPQFIEELMMGMGDSREVPNIQVDRATHESDFNNPNLLKQRQSKLKDQIDNVLGSSKPAQRTTSFSKIRQSRKFERQITQDGNKDLASRNALGAKYGYNAQQNKSINESGIYFFKDQEDIGDSFEVRVVGEGELKSDLLQFIHCQAMFLEENRETIKIMQE